MGAPLHMITTKALPYTAIFNTPSECSRWVHLVKEWQKANPDIKGGDYRYFLAEEFLRVHIIIQRLYDRRYFWDGSPTHLTRTREHDWSLPLDLMEELPIERFWRDARVERIWEGTSEIQRHIISRAMLRPLGS